MWFMGSAEELMFDPGAATEALAKSIEYRRNHESRNVGALVLQAA